MYTPFHRSASMGLGPLGVETGPSSTRAKARLRGDEAVSHPRRASGLGGRRLRTGPKARLREDEAVSHPRRASGLGGRRLHTGPKARFRQDGSPLERAMPWSETALTIVGGIARVAASSCSPDGFAPGAIAFECLLPRSRLAPPSSRGSLVDVPASCSLHRSIKALHGGSSTISRGRRPMEHRLPVGRARETCSNAIALGSPPPPRGHSALFGLT